MPEKPQISHELASFGTGQQEANMTDKPHPWPYVAANARDSAAEEALKAIKCLEPLVEFESDIDKLRRISRTLLSLYRIARLLESVGANTRP